MEITLGGNERSGTRYAFSPIDSSALIRSVSGLCLSESTRGTFEDRLVGARLTKVDEVPLVFTLDVRLEIKPGALGEAIGVDFVLAGLMTSDEIRLVGVTIEAGGLRSGEREGDCEARDTRLDRRLGVLVSSADLAV